MFHTKGYKTKYGKKTDFYNTTWPNVLCFRVGTLTKRVSAEAIGLRATPFRASEGIVVIVYGSWMLDAGG